MKPNISESWLSDVNFEILTYAYSNALSLKMVILQYPPFFWWVSYPLINLTIDFTCFDLAVYVILMNYRLSIKYVTYKLVFIKPKFQNLNYLIWILKCTICIYKCTFLKKGSFYCPTFFFFFFVGTIPTPKSNHGFHLFWSGCLCDFNELPIISQACNV